MQSKTMLSSFRIDVTINAETKTYVIAAKSAIDAAKLAIDWLGNAGALKIEVKPVSVQNF